MKAWWKWQLVTIFAFLARAALPEASAATYLATALEFLILASGVAAGGLLLAGLLGERRQFDGWMRAHRARQRILE